MTSNPFSSDCFLGYVNEVAPQSVTIHFPAANLLPRFCVARESKRTIAKVSAPVPLVMGQVLRFYVVALRC